MKAVRPDLGYDFAPSHSETYRFWGVRVPGLCRARESVAQLPCDVAAVELCHVRRALSQDV